MTRKKEEPRITEANESVGSSEENLASEHLWGSNEVREPAGPYESNDGSAAQAIGQVMDSIGRNLDRTVETLTRLESKLASAHEH